MPRLSAHRFGALSLAGLALVAALAGCGGGSDDDSPPNLALLEGTWLADRCTSFDGVGFRETMRVTREGDTRFSPYRGRMSYVNADCTGNSTFVPGVPVHGDSFVVSRARSTASLTAIWANYWPSQVSASEPSSLWVRRGEHLCQSYFASPAAPADNKYDMDRIERDTAAAVQNRACYIRIP